MILTIDVGNTDTVFCFYDGEKVALNARAATKPYKNLDEYLSFFQELKHKIPKSSLEGIIISSVVPTLKALLQASCRKVFDVEPLLLGENNVRVDLNIKIDKPASLGADRIANGVGAIKKYKKNVIIVDFGTATNFDVIGEENDFIGGIIAPGIKTSIQSLHDAAALLPMYEVAKPSKVVATSLEDALHSGIFYGSIGMIEHLIGNIKKELKKDFKVVSTGGLGGLFTKHTNSIDIYDEHLTTFGLLEIYKFNQI